MPYLSASEVCSRWGAILIHVYLTLPHHYSNSAYHPSTLVLHCQHSGLNRWLWSAVDDVKFIITLLSDHDKPYCHPCHLVQGRSTTAVIVPPRRSNAMVVPLTNAFWKDISLRQTSQLQAFCDAWKAPKSVFSVVTMPDPPESVGAHSSPPWCL